MHLPVLSTFTSWLMVFRIFIHFHVDRVLPKTDLLYLPMLLHILPKPDLLYFLMLKLCTSQRHYLYKLVVLFSNIVHLPVRCIGLIIEHVQLIYIKNAIYMEYELVQITSSVVGLM
jgi:hypothetical protein